MILARWRETCPGRRARSKERQTGAQPHFQCSPLDVRCQGEQLQNAHDPIECKKSYSRCRFLTDKINQQATVEISSHSLAGVRFRQKDVQYNAEDVGPKDGPNIR